MAYRVARETTHVKPVRAFACHSECRHAADAPFEPGLTSVCHFDRHLCHFDPYVSHSDPYICHFDRREKSSASRNVL